MLTLINTMQKKMLYMHKIVDLHKCVYATPSYWRVKNESFNQLTVHNG